MSDTRRVVVVGASRAGTTVARTLRDRGFSGSVTVVGDEPQEPYDRTHLSKQALTQGVGAEAFPLCRADDLVDVDLRLGSRAIGLDTARRVVALADDGELEYDALFIATGATPRWPSALPRLAGVHVLRTFSDVEALRADLTSANRVLVVGGGFIGAEVAAAARLRGLQVTLVEAGGTLLERGLGADIGAEWTSLHRSKGVEVRCGAAVDTLLEQDGRVSGARLVDGATVAADMVVIGVGADPVTGWLSGSGLELDGGVICDASLRAADNVFAVGDVARWRDAATGELRRIEHWTNAHEQGRHAAGTFLGDDLPFTTVPYVWSDQYDYRLQIYGSTEKADAIRVLDPGEQIPRLVIYGREGRVTGVVGVGAARELLPWRRAIAANREWDEAMRELTA